MAFFDSLRAFLQGRRSTQRPWRRLAAPAILLVLAGAGIASAALRDWGEANEAGTPAALSLARGKGVLRIGVDRAPRTYGAAAYETRRDEGFEAVIRDALAEELGVRVEMTALEPADQARAVESGQVDLLLVRQAAPVGAFAVDSGYASGFTLLMRSDTSIGSWKDAAGKTICHVDDNRAGRDFIRAAGGIAMAHWAPAKALSAVRAGDCDAALLDHAVAEKLAQHPRWQKFNAILPPAPASRLIFIARSGDRVSARLLGKLGAKWRRDAWATWKDNWVTEVDFETYIEQYAPDCH